MRNIIVTAVLAGLAWSGLGCLNALAAELEDAQGLLRKGDAKEAADAALALNSAEGYALAAKATTLGASLAPENMQEGLFDKAVGYARKAIELGAGNADAHFELARADGRLAQFKGVLQSLSLANEVKNELGRAIELNPKMAGAYVALGLWNAEVPFFAGGNRSQVQPNFEKAIALEPQVITHRLEYANALMKVNRRNKPSAVAVLERAVLLPARDFWEARDLDAAKKMLAELKR